MPIALSKKVFESILNFIYTCSKFLIEDKKFKYYFYSYVNTWDNERTVEIPFFNYYLKSYLNINKKVLEIGNVLSHYIKNNSK